MLGLVGLQGHNSMTHLLEMFRVSPSLQFLFDRSVVPPGVRLCDYLLSHKELVWIKVLTKAISGTPIKGIPYSFALRTAIAQSTFATWWDNKNDTNQKTTNKNESRWKQYPAQEQVLTALR